MVFGRYSDATPNILCSFYIFDLHDENQLITRLSDEYTFADGSFSSSTFKINEPELKRGQDYNLFVCCSMACANGVFKVLQKEDIALGVTSEAMIWDLVFWTAPENSFTAIFIFFMALFVIGIIAFWLRKAI